MFANIAQVIMHLKLPLGFIFAAIALSTSALAIPGLPSTVTTPPFPQELDKEAIDWLDRMVAENLIPSRSATIVKEDPELFYRFFSQDYKKYKRTGFPFFSRGY